MPNEANSEINLFSDEQLTDELEINTPIFDSVDDIINTNTDLDIPNFRDDMVENGLTVQDLRTLQFVVRTVYEVIDYVVVQRKEGQKENQQDDPSDRREAS